MARVLFRVIHTAGIHCQYCIFLLTIQVESQFTRMQYEVFNKSLHSLGCRFWMANDIKNLLVVGTWVLTFLTFLEVTVLNLLVNPHQELRFIKSFFLQSHSNSWRISPILSPLFWCLRHGAGGFVFFADYLKFSR